MDCDIPTAHNTLLILAVHFTDRCCNNGGGQYYQAAATRPQEECPKATSPFPDHHVQLRTQILGHSTKECIFVNNTSAMHNAPHTPFL